MPWVLRSFWTGSGGRAPRVGHGRRRSSLRTAADRSVFGRCLPRGPRYPPHPGARRRASRPPRGGAFFPPTRAGRTGLRCWRREQHSAVGTPSHWGYFFPPTRVSRMLTAISARQDSELALAHELPEIGHLALLHPAHQLAHLLELLDELVDLLDA